MGKISFHLFDRYRRNWKVVDRAPHRALVDAVSDRAIVASGPLIDLVPLPN
jgi:hypothetical protein